ncbi:branched-chain amino acid ABC transporter permease [Neobacillus sp. 114]|uniref:branched-chain amino acid ABC transporter permease n=1 Tax=Neobacillus sp. 114 TaxID=3048535 RepID=UPI001C21B7B6|nr:branched-chain amino acid ABC transporter permease [Neobacillus sp. 114]MBU8918846.1 branched-chain amino acid ABC transporter permease [Bacillus sp. FJAT-29953]
MGTVIVQAIVEGILNAGIFSLVAIGLTLIFGVMKIVNFAHGDFLMVALYVAYLVFITIGLHPYISAVIVVPVMFLIGVIFYKFFIKKIQNAPESSQILLTIGISFVLQNLALLFFSSDLKSITSSLADVSYQLGPVSIRMHKFWGFVVGIGVSSIFYYILRFTDFGRLIRASSQNSQAAHLVGVNVEKVLLLSAGIGIALLGIASSWLIPITFVSPSVGSIYLLPVFIIVILGGLGSVRGAMFGALLYSLSDTLGAALIPGSLGLVIPLLLFIAVLILRPEGLFRGAI